MNKLRSFYKIFDPNPGKSGCVEIFRDDAEYWNHKDFGIFWTVNQFDGPRKKENLVKILSWAVDMDQGSKDEQWALIKSAPFPSLVTETKKGFHVYYNATDGTVENFDTIVADRLVPFFNADKNAKDLSRVLRAPGFYHCKDINNKFLVKIVWQQEISYEEKDMLHLFPLSKEKEHESNSRQELRHVFKADGDNFWERIWNMDCAEALRRLSGTEHVCSEKFTFQRTSSGNLNILVDGKSTSCWIDRDMRIGSHDKGGPTIWQWVNWYHRNQKTTYQVIKTMFPEMWSNENGRK